MNNSTSAGTSNTALAALDNARDREYNIYTSMQNINGHRLTYINNGSLPGEFGVISTDFIAIIVTGAAPSSQVL